VEARKAATPLDELKMRLSELGAPRDFRAALRGKGISLIAEVKKASPSKGVLRADFNPAELAGQYERAGADAISVLTDEKYFQGALADLEAVRRQVAVPCLRKDFIVDEYQLYEARAAQADAVLLIVRALSDDQLRDYLNVAKSLQMAALVETHDVRDIERAINAGAHILGINNRDLATFQVSLNTTLELRRHVPGGHVLVSESGIHTREHVQLLEDGGIDAILVGESLVTSDNIGAKIRELLPRDQG
jgi:indole-3-glycerol phosphate synthase